MHRRIHKSSQDVEGEKGIEEDEAREEEAESERVRELEVINSVENEDKL